MSSLKTFSKRSLDFQPDDSDSSEDYMEDITVIWFDQYMDQPDNQHDVERTKSLLKEINDYVLFYSKPAPCIQYIKSVEKEKIFLITSGSFARDNIDKIHQLKQIDSIFIFCVYRANYLPLKSKYSKIVEVFTEQKDLMESLKDNIQSFVKQSILYGLIDNKQRLTKYLTKLTTEFFGFQLLIDILKTNTILSDTKTSNIEEMLNYCQCYYRGNQTELNIIEQFRKQYRSEDAIVWFSKQSFVYRLINKALRTQDIDALHIFRIYITHLRSQILNEYNKLRKIKTDTIRLYRGLKMTHAEINQLRDYIGGLISINEFFSTSRNIDQATIFATKKSHRKDVVNVLVQIDGDFKYDQMIFADIAQYSAFPKEQEVIFDLGTIFKIGQIEFNKEKQVWIVQLSGVDKANQTVNEYIKIVEKENEETNPPLLLSRMMCDMGKYGKAVKYLKRLLNNTPPNHRDISKINFYLGRVAYFRGEYKIALDYYDDTVDLQKRDISPQENSFELARTLHNIGNIYSELKKFSEAIVYYRKAFEMKRAIYTDHPNHPTIAITLTAMGSIYRRRGDFEKSLELALQGLEIKKLSLVSNHPSISESLNHLGIIYLKMKNYNKALEHFQKALHIKQLSLPSTHPSISLTLNSMGFIYHKIGDYSKALICYTQVLQLLRTASALDYSDLVDIYHNLCALYYDMCDYDKALEMARCKLNMLKRIAIDDNEQIQRTKNDIDEITHAKTQPLVITREIPYFCDAHFEYL